MKIPVAILLIPISIWLRAYTFRALWHWFIATPFHVADVGLALAFGLSIFGTFLTANVLAKSDEKLDKVWKQYLIVIAFSGLTLGSGWVTQMFMR